MYGSGDGEPPAPPAAPAPCLQLGSHTLPPHRISGGVPGHCNGGGMPSAHYHQNQCFPAPQHQPARYHRVTNNLDSMPSHPATAPAMPGTAAAAWNHLHHNQHHQHESPEMANSCAASGGHDVEDDVQHQPRVPAGYQQASRGAHGGAGAAGRRGDGQQGTVFGGTGGERPSGTAVSGTAGSGGDQDDAVSGARHAAAGGHGRGKDRDGDQSGVQHQVMEALRKLNPGKQPTWVMLG